LSALSLAKATGGATRIPASESANSFFIMSSSVEVAVGLIPTMADFAQYRSPNAQQKEKFLS
jgi:hypothetical protein